MRYPSFCVIFMAGILVVGCDGNGDKSAASGAQESQFVTSQEQGIIKQSGNDASKKEEIPLSDADKQGVPVNIVVEKPEPVSVK